ncbi:MAG TPA: hypothetical protein VNI84_17285 [Pyrinomonadaceae bacterium]|nr:hypothetical protein [Pyrinomonadaceae bacterium]
MRFLETLFVMLVVTLIPLVIYALSKCGKDFDPVSWLYFSQTRLYLALVLIALFSAVIAFVPEASAILTAVGFNAEKPSALGLAIGGMLVAGIRGNESD